MRKSKHDCLVRELEKELIETKHYERMWLFWEYCRNGYVGELDLLAFSGGVYDMYEIKCTLHSKSFKKANEQYDRFKLAFPYWETNGFLYTSNRELITL